MRLRSGHITIGIIVLVIAFVMVAVWRGTSGPGREEEVAGSLPPVGAAQDLVASMAVDSNEVDLGVIPNTGEGHGKLAVHNRGKGPLKINEVRSSCACTEGSFAPNAMPIPPGASADLNITVHPKRIFGFESKKTLTLFSNDPVRPSIEVTVSAKVDPEFSLEPDKFDFGNFAKGASAVRESRLTSRLSKPFNVTGVSSVQPESKEEAPLGLQLELIPVPENEWKTPGHSEYLIRATVSSDMPPGPFDLGAYISFDLPRFRFLRVPVHGIIEAPYKVEMPTRLHAVVIQAGTADTRVKVLAAEPVSLESAVAENGTVTVGGNNISGGMELVFAPVSGQSAGRHDDRVRARLRVGGKTFEELFEVRVFSGTPAKTEP